MNLLAAKTQNPRAQNQIYNVAFNDTTSLNDLYLKLKQIFLELQPKIKINEPIFKDFRPGDIKSTTADISKAKSLLGYHPTHNVVQGLKETVAWYLERGLA
jgi:UDP-N-acetylglucosamine 4-epimerase